MVPILVTGKLIYISQAYMSFMILKCSYTYFSWFLPYVRWCMGVQVIMLNNWQYLHMRMTYSYYMARTCFAHSSIFWNLIAPMFLLPYHRVTHTRVLWILFLFKWSRSLAPAPYSPSSSKCSWRIVSSLDRMYAYMLCVPRAILTSDWIDCRAGIMSSLCFSSYSDIRLDWL